MTTRFYQWGNQAGGTTPNGPSAPASTGYGVGESYTGTVGAAGTTITFTNSTKSVTIRNTHDSNNLEYSIDGGTTWLLLGPYGSITESVTLTSIRLRMVAAAVVTYEVIGIITS